MSTDPYREWDAAYLLGALSPAERREFEDHLEQCPECAEAVAELAGVPGTLRGLDAETAQSLDDPVPDTLLPRLLRAAARRRRRIVGAVAATLVAAAAVAAIVIPLALGSGVERRELTLEPVVPGPISAEVTLISHDWGTRLDTHCNYEIRPQPTGHESGYEYDDDAVAYAMWITGRDGSSEEVATWTASPGTSATPTATTRLSPAEIAVVDIRAVATGDVLLRARP